MRGKGHKPLSGGHPTKVYRSRHRQQDRSKRRKQDPSDASDTTASLFYLVVAVKCPSMARPKIHLLGDSALVVEAPAPTSLGHQARVWAVAEHVRTWPFVVDVVPGMNNLTIVFDPLRADPPAMARQLEQAWTAAAKSRARTGKTVDIPVRYGGTHGPDLQHVADVAGMDKQAVAELHAAGSYTVYFVGFKPGFAYLGGLDARLHMPRHAEPRLNVPAGSVAIGGEQTGIYPSASPGGWQLIGLCDARMFDPTREPASLLEPGDQVRFIVESVA